MSLKPAPKPLSSRGSGNQPLGGTTQPPTTTTKKRATSLVRKSPVARPRTSSFRRHSEYINLSVAPGSENILNSSSNSDSATNDTKSEMTTKADDPKTSQTRNELQKNNSLIITVFGGNSSNNNSATVLRNHNNNKLQDNDDHKTSHNDATDGANEANTTNEDTPTITTSNTASVSSTPKVQRSLAVKNKEALEAIRQSLSNKLISPAPPSRVIESMKASGATFDVDSDANKVPINTTKAKVEKKVSSSFEDARAALEGALQFSRHTPATTNSSPTSANSSINDSSSAPSTTSNTASADTTTVVSTPSSAKRQAPKPPAVVTNNVDSWNNQQTDSLNGSSIHQLNDWDKGFSRVEDIVVAKDDKNDEGINKGVEQRFDPDVEVGTNDQSCGDTKTVEDKAEAEQTNIYEQQHNLSTGINSQQSLADVLPETPKLTPAIRHSSMKSDLKPRDSKPRSVQFSPDTMTVTVPANERPQKMISYNRWIAKNPYLESSFTGQPISMLPPGAVPPNAASKKKMVPYPTAPVVDDTPRKWTEKKKKWRSKSTPRVSEIDELMGSSKTKAPSKLAIFTSPPSPGPIRRQSRVEIYESEKQKVVPPKKGKFSLKNLFFSPNGTNQGNTGGDGNTNSAISSGNSGSQNTSENKFIDKEHEREILERQQKKKVRPEIIHPLDLINGGVEVVKITPKNSLKGKN